MGKPLQRIPRFQLTLDDKQFRAIGHMVIQWAFLENEINRNIACLLTRCEHKNRSVNFQARFSARTTDWTNLAIISYRKNPKYIKAVQRIAGNAVNIKTERDVLVHGHVSGQGTFFKLRDGKAVDVSHMLGQASYIEDLACRISDISADLSRHHQRLRRHYRKSP